MCDLPNIVKRSQTRDVPITFFGADHRSPGISICRYRYYRSQRQIHKFFYLFLYCSSPYIFNDSSYTTLTLYISIYIITMGNNALYLPNWAGFIELGCFLLNWAGFKMCFGWKIRIWQPWSQSGTVPRTLSPCLSQLFQLVQCSF